eukprot:g6775.t1
MSSSSPAPPATNAPGLLPPYRGTPKILLVGDSLTQSGNSVEEGWAIQLQRIFIRRADVVNRGLSGWTSRWVRSYIGDILKYDLPAPPPAAEHQAESLNASKVLFATVWLGANDAWLPESSPKHATPVAEFETNMREICGEILKHTETLFLMSPPPIAEAARQAFALKTYGESKVDRTNAHTGAYVKAVEKLSQQLNAEHGPGKKIVYVDVFSLLFEKRESLLPDGLHLGVEANKLLFDALNRKLAELGLSVSADPLRGHHGCKGSVSNVAHALPWHEDCQ